jgi:uncharacterized protein involved in exopolysaccharide biosynthesis
MKNQEFVKYCTPTEYLKVFFRRKWLMITPAFIGLVLGIVYCFISPPTYEASSTILVEEEKIINPLIQNLAVSTSAAQRIDRIKEIVLSWNSLSELTKELNLAKNAQTPDKFEKFILNLKDDIQVEMNKPQIIKISYSGQDPKETFLIAKTLTDILIRKNTESQTKETEVAINFIKEQLAIYKRKIKESEIAQIEDELKNLLIDSTEQHPMVKELRHKIAVAKNELESGEYKVVSAEQPITDAARQVLKNELDKMLASKDTAFAVSPAFASETKNEPNPAAIYKLLLMDKVGASLAQDIDVNKDIYQMLLQRLETARITQRLEVSKEGTRYTIIEPARLPLKPARPNKIKIIFLGMFLGSFAGTGLVFSREFMDRSFLDIDEAKQNLEFPILGAISRIVSQEQIDKEKIRTKTLIVGSLIVAGSLIVLSMLYYFIR